MLRQNLDHRGVLYELLTRTHPAVRLERAERAQTAKRVIPGDRGGFLMAVVPSTREVDLEFLRRYIGRDLGARIFQLSG